MNVGLILFQRMENACILMDALPILNESTTNEKSTISDVEAYEDIIRVLNQSNEPVTLLFTGPLTDLAKALKIEPSIQIILKISLDGWNVSRKR